MNNRQLGAVLMAAAVILAVTGYLYVSRSESFLLSQIKTGPEGECIHTGPVCPYEQLHELTVPKYIGGALLLVIFGWGAYLFRKKTQQETAIVKATADAKTLVGEEAQVFDLVTSSDGMIFQNELVEKTQLGKVRVTRILDKLEGKGLIERRRRGMTNVVILKQ
ncbi:MarR family transcriptional regulator [Candidatus Woesearchaeota archaeon]|nr:MarR family transcriptional regulator [Candidatus Woesearchaeota archaeon]